MDSRNQKILLGLSIAAFLGPFTQTIYTPSLPSQSTSLVNLFLNEKGTAMGVYNFVRFTGAAIGPLFGTTLYHLGGDDALYITLFAFLLGSAFVIQRTMRQTIALQKGA